MIVIRDTGFIYDNIWQKYCYILEIDRANRHAQTSQNIIDCHWIILIGFGRNQGNESHMHTFIFEVWLYMYLLIILQKRLTINMKLLYGRMRYVWQYCSIHLIKYVSYQRSGSFSWVNLALQQFLKIYTTLNNDLQNSLNLAKFGLGKCMPSD